MHVDEGKTDVDSEKGESSCKQRKVKGPPTVGPGKTKLWDVGGNGDCGYRALYAAYARRGKDKEEATRRRQRKRLGIRRKNLKKVSLKMRR